LLLQRRKAATQGADDGPAFLDDPRGWIQARQRAFYSKMSGALTRMKRESAWTAAWTLMLLSFVYGVLHAAGPGHGKAVVSAWLLANERQLRRGVLISFMAAALQAMTAIVLVTGLLLSVKAAAKTAKSMAIGLEAASFGLIALTGLWLVWQAVQAKARTGAGTGPCRQP
jgi:nickel/cobalt exporter